MPDMWEILMAVLGLACVAGLLVGVLVLPVIAFVRTRRIGELADRVSRLESELRQFRPEPGAEPVVPAPGPPAVPPGTVPEVQPAVARPAAPPPPRRAAAAMRPVAADVEAWIGRRALGWVAVVLLLFATAFFLKTAFDNRWIGELGRVALGVAAGAGLCAGGSFYHRRGWRVFSQMLTAGGIVLLYLTTFASFGYYHLLPQEHAGAFLVLLVAEAGALAILYDAPAIAIMAVVGGLLNPLLLHADHDQYRSLFVYLLVLNSGVVALTLSRAWPALGTVALVGSQFLFSLWFLENYHPEKRWEAAAFQLGLFGLYLAQTPLAAALRPQRARAEDLVRALVNPFLFFGAVYAMFEADSHVWMGTLAVGLGIVYTLVAWFLTARRPDDVWAALTTVTAALGFVALAIPLEADAAWVPVGWAVQGLALWWFGLRTRALPFRAMGATLLVVAVFRLLILDTPFEGRPPFIPLLNEFGTPAVIVAACLLAAAWLGRRARGQPWGEVVAARVAGVAGVLLLWFILTLEIYQFFAALGEFYPVSFDHLRVANTAVSATWAVYAGLVLLAGFKLPSRPLRWMALGLFGLTLLKVVIIDMAGLPGFYRVAAFLALALVLAVAARGYQQFQLSRAEREEEGV